MSKRCFRCRFM